MPINCFLFLCRSFAVTPNLPPPNPGQPGPFSLGGKGALRDALLLAGFEDIQERRMPAPLKMKSAADCVRFERESFGALHTMPWLASIKPEKKRWGKKLPRNCGNLKARRALKAPAN
jgi:hypothetical protein